VVRYGRLFTSAEVTQVHIGSDTFWIVEGARFAKGWSPVMGDAVLASWLALIRRFTGKAVAPTMAEFACPRPAEASRHRDLFGDVLRFDGPTYALQFPKAILDLPIVGGDLVLGAILERQAQELLGQGADESPLLRRIDEALAQGEPDLMGVALALAMHPRTLQRRLTELGLDWRTVRDRHRRQTAERLLATPGIGIKKVAAAAGFANVRSFRRAFRRWTGQGPGAGS
jgi:AraC-like DNA-binding protein